MVARFACLAAVVGLAAAAAGCGGSSSAASQRATTPANGPRGARFQQFAQCLRSKGVVLPNQRPQPGSGGPRGLSRDPKFRQAAQACRRELFGGAAPQGPGGGPPGGPQGAAPTGPGGAFQ